MRRVRIRLFPVVLGLAAGMASIATAAFQSLQTISVSMGASVGGESSPLFDIQATPLPDQVFFGNHLVIPVEITRIGGTLTTQNLQIEFRYRLEDSASQPLSDWISVPVIAQLDPQRPNAVLGSAVVPRVDLAPIEPGGRLNYVFQVRQGTNATTRSRSGVSVSTDTDNSLNDAFQTSVVKTLQAPVGPDGAEISVPDFFQPDGATSVAFDPGALAGSGEIRIRREPLSGWPPGPKGLAPILVYSFELEGATLERTAKLTLNYPANLDGTVTEARVSASDLAIYWLEEPFGWRMLSRPQLDRVKNTVSGVTSHFSIFALFPVGPVTAADLRPMERTLTPNGDGINDTAAFSGLTADEEVKIYDLRGRQVRTLRGPTAVWDGRKDDGGLVESGVYIYQYRSLGELVSGVIAVVK